MPKYAMLSIPIVLALVVGWIAFEIKLSALNPPTKDEIRNAPSLRSGDEGGATSPGEVFDYEKWKRDWEEKSKALNSQNAETQPKAPAEKPAPKRLRPMDYRENKQIARSNAIIKARKTGAAVGLVTLALGYVGLALYFVRLSRKRSEEARAPVTAAGPGAAAPAGEETAFESPAYEEPSTDETPIEIPEAGLYEPYEPPIHISELEADDEEDRDEEGSEKA